MAEVNETPIIDNSPITITTSKGAFVTPVQITAHDTDVVAGVPNTLHYYLGSVGNTSLDGLTIDSHDLITGTAPQVIGNKSFAVDVIVDDGTGSANSVAHQTLMFNVNDSPLVLHSLGDVFKIEASSVLGLQEIVWNNQSFDGLTQGFFGHDPANDAANIFVETLYENLTGLGAGNPLPSQILEAAIAAHGAQNVYVQFGYAGGILNSGTSVATGGNLGVDLGTGADILGIRFGPTSLPPIPNPGSVSNADVIAGNLSAADVAYLNAIINPLAVPGDGQYVGGLLTTIKIVTAQGAEISLNLANETGIFGSSDPITQIFNFSGTLATIESTKLVRADGWTPEHPALTTSLEIQSQLIEHIFLVHPNTV